jgi:hypothetical protein
LLSSRNQFAHFPPDSGLKTIGFFCNVDPHSDGGNGKQGLFDMIAAPILEPTAGLRRDSVSKSTHCATANGGFQESSSGASRPTAANCVS